MRPPTDLEPAPDDASKVRLASLVSHEHPLYRLAEAIDWTRFEAALGPLYAEVSTSWSVTICSARKVTASTRC